MDKREEENIDDEEEEIPFDYGDEEQEGDVNENNENNEIDCSEKTTSKREWEESGIPLIPSNVPDLKFIEEVDGISIMKKNNKETPFYSNTLKIESYDIIPNKYKKNNREVKYNVS